MVRRLMRFAMVALGLAIIAPRVSAQRPDGEGLSKQAAAESLQVLATLKSQAQTSPDNAALQFRIGRIAFALVLRSRMRDTVPGLDRAQLQITAREALSKATNLDARNVEYLLTYSSYLTGAYGGGDYGFRQLADQLIARANAIASADPDANARVRLLLQFADVHWTNYEKSLIDTIPMEGFKDGLPDKPRTERAADPERKPMSSPENHRPLPSGGGGTSVTASMSAIVNDMMKDDLRPDIRLRGGDIPDTAWGPITVGMAAGQRNAGAPLPRMLAAATSGALQRLSRMGDDKPTELQERPYLYARLFFDSAYAVAPENERAWRGVAKTRLEKYEWAALEKLAREHMARVPADQWGWLALGLAKQRQRETQNARVAFDSGLVRMPTKERAHLDRVDRIMRPSDIPTYARLDSAERAKYDAAAWFLADPIWSVDVGEPRLEFLARIAHAELRWSTFVPRVYGADTDDGKRFVRYGPPVKTLNNLLLYPGGIILSSYGAWGHTALGRLVKGEIATLNPRIYQWQPARWDNVSQIDVDSMPVQAARFRAGTDSADFFLATRAPLEKLDSVRTINSVPFAKFWIYGWNTPNVEKDSLGLTRTGAMQWTRRLSLGMYNYRVETIMPGTLAAGRAAANIIVGADTSTGFAMIGFGMSDLLIATTAEMPNNARRWSDVSFVPLTGSVAKGGQISVVWENYEVGRRGADAEYNVSMTLAREELFGDTPSLAIVSGTTGSVRREAKENQISLNFDRMVPYAPLIVDNLTLSFGETPVGSYLLTVSVTDRVSGRTTGRTTRIIIAK